MPFHRNALPFVGRGRLFAPDGRHRGVNTSGLRATVESSPGSFNADASDIPDIVIRRLPIYARTIKSLADQDIESVSSEELADLIGVTAAQIRRDFSYFGRFGRQGKGYHVGFLADAIDGILRLDRKWPMVLCGMGKVGHAVAGYRGFSRTPFNVIALFDMDETRVGEVVGDLTVQPMSEMAPMMREQAIRIGIISTPKVNAQEAADAMVEGGVEAILNYAPVILRVPKNVTVREIDPVSALQSMTYYIEDH